MNHKGQPCTVEGCDKPINCRGWCSMHYWRWRTHGDISVNNSGRDLPMVDRFWMKVQKRPGCWNWTGGARDGYGTFTEKHKGRTHLAHRLSYELTVGPIPDGKVLDHRCRNTLCVNPSHLRPVTRKQNGEHRGGARRDSSTGVLGVHVRKNRFVAAVGHNGKTYGGGSFKTLEEAAQAVKDLRLSLFTHNDADRRSA